MVPSSFQGLDRVWADTVAAEYERIVSIQADDTVAAEYEGHRVREDRERTYIFQLLCLQIVGYQIIEESL